MTKNTITTFQHGELFEQAEPGWFISANEAAHAEPLDWHAALDKVLRSGRGQEGVELELGNCAMFVYWVVPDGGHYGEFVVPGDIVEGVWIPEEADWLPFRTRHVMPFLQAHAAVVLANNLQRLLQHMAPATKGPIPRHAEHAPLPPALLEAAQWGARR